MRFDKLIKLFVRYRSGYNESAELVSESKQKNRECNDSTEKSAENRKAKKCQAREPNQKQQTECPGEQVDHNLSFAHATREKEPQDMEGADTATQLATLVAEDEIIVRHDSWLVQSPRDKGVKSEDRTEGGMVKQKRLIASKLSQEFDNCHRYKNTDNFVCALAILRYLLRRRTTMGGAGCNFSGRDKDGSRRLFPRMVP